MGDWRNHTAKSSSTAALDCSFVTQQGRIPVNIQFEAILWVYPIAEVLSSSRADQETTRIFDGNAKLEVWKWCRSPSILVGDVRICDGTCARSLFLQSRTSPGDSCSHQRPRLRKN